ncbi:phosphonate C-P lyase system protein PhnG [Gymnodinialimonas sp. 2305UL16-5]|uniref:phosphonate C-P lyase system protein PhnG n=1 Tax=Gymnodinialimonas mytili TaxID=3126503 RepID=UPI0030B25CBE
MSETAATTNPKILARQHLLSEPTCADVTYLAQLWARFEAAHDLPSPDILRPAELGTVTVRDRAGATGAAFNSGEMSVTRISVQLPCGAVGHGYVQGRDKDHARIAAMIDAFVWSGMAALLEQAIMAPIRDRRIGLAEKRAAKAAATKVAFFTMARGEG